MPAPSKPPPNITLKTYLRMRIPAFLLILFATTANVYPADIPEFGYKVVHVYPHDPVAFTEGLFYLDGFLYEATGLAGKSSVRKVKLETGKVVQQQEIAKPYFGEGIVAVRDHLIQLTYTTETGFVYNLKTLTLERQFHYPGQGWALTYDGHQI